MYVWSGVSVRRRPTNSQHAIATTCAGQPVHIDDRRFNTTYYYYYYNRIHVREGEGRAEGQV